MASGPVGLSSRQARLPLCAFPTSEATHSSLLFKGCAVDSASARRAHPGAHSIRAPQVRVRFFADFFFRALAVDTLGVEVFYKASFLKLGSLYVVFVVIPEYPHVRFDGEYLGHGPPCGRTVALRVSSSLLMCTHSSSLSQATWTTTDLRLPRVKRRRSDSSESKLCVRFPGGVKAQLSCALFFSR